MANLRNCIVGVSLAFVAINAVGAEAYPSRPIRMITTPPGGGSDVMARLIGHGLTEALGQQVVVDNRPSGVILGGIAAKAPADGYTIVVSGSGLWLAPLLQEATYDPVKDFAPISMPAQVPNVLVIHPSVPAKTVSDLIALAKAKPGTLNYSSGSTGAIAHLAGELFKSKAGVQIVRINYKGAGPSLNAVISGEVQMMFPSAGSVSSHIAAGRLRALGVTTLQPTELLPGLPTIASAGLPGYEAVSPFGIFAPSGTPQAIISKLSTAAINFVKKPDVRERFLKLGMEPVGSTPAQLKATIESEVTKWRQVIKEAGIGKR